MTQASPEHEKRFMTFTDSSAAAGDDFLARIETSLADGRFVKLVLAKPRAAGDLLRVTVRRVELRGVGDTTIDGLLPLEHPPWSWPQR